MTDRPIDPRVVPTQYGRERLLTPGEVAALFRVDPKTVTRWASSGRIGSIRTPGGHRRFRESEVRELLDGGLRETEPAPAAAPAAIPTQSLTSPPAAGLTSPPAAVPTV